MTGYEVRPIGWVVSDLDDRAAAPKQGYEGAPDAWIVFDTRYAVGVKDLRPGDQIYVLTWLHLAGRDVLATRPRNDPSKPLTGVFSTRSPDRPNPVGLHRVEIVEVDGLRIRVADLEAVDQTPIIDIKPVLKGGR